MIVQALDLPSVVTSLRRQRGGMVQTADQYVFVYLVMLRELQALGSTAARGPA
jgi:tyrosine-protein phosphatase non-receptor type 9